jgi:hypothetical protein
MITHLFIPKVVVVVVVVVMVVVVVVVVDGCKVFDIHEMCIMG